MFSFRLSFFTMAALSCSFSLQAYPNFEAAKDFLNQTFNIKDEVIVLDGVYQTSGVGVDQGIETCQVYVDTTTSTTGPLITIRHNQTRNTSFGRGIYKEEEPYRVRVKRNRLTFRYRYFDSLATGEKMRVRVRRSDDSVLVSVRDRVRFLFIPARSYESCLVTLSQ